MRERDIAGATGRCGKAEADQPRLQRVKRIGFGIDGNNASTLRFSNPCL
jgi:hypothetical protein